MNWQSTKFIQTSFVVIAAYYALINGHLEDTFYVTVTLGALANYAYHDVKQKMIDD